MINQIIIMTQRNMVIYFVLINATKMVIIYMVIGRFVLKNALMIMVYKPLVFIKIKHVKTKIIVMNFKEYYNLKIKLVLNIVKETFILTHKIIHVKIICLKYKILNKTNTDLYILKMLSIIILV